MRCRPNRRRILLTASLAAFLAAGPVAADECVKLQADKRTYLVHEPVYLSLELRPDKAPSGFRFGPLEDLGVSFSLQVQGPDSRPFRYRPPMRTESFSGPNPMIEYSTLVVHRGGTVTSRPGLYVLRLLDDKGDPVSAACSVMVRLPSEAEDVKAHDIILENPMAYGMFAYLEGGDHIEAGHAQFIRLAELNSTYTPVARTVLAMNYSHSSFDAKKGRLRRGRMPDKVDRFFPSASDPVPTYLKLKSSFMVKQEFKENPPGTVGQRISGIKATLQDRSDNKSRFFQAISR